MAIVWSSLMEKSTWNIERTFIIPPSEVGSYNCVRVLYQQTCA